MRSTFYAVAGAVLLWSAALAFSKPLSDSMSSSIGFSARPGLTELMGQQNLSPRFGMLAAYERDDYRGTIYSGWALGGNFLLFRALGDDWQSSSVLSAGLGGMQGDDHGHSTVWSKLDLDWENRHVLFAVFGQVQRGTKMPKIDEFQARAGYSPMEPEMNAIQPWVVFAAMSRSGIGKPNYMTLLRLITGRWFLEAGAALNTDNRILNFGVSL